MTITRSVTLAAAVLVVAAACSGNGAEPEPDAPGEQSVGATDEGAPTADDVDADEELTEQELVSALGARGVTVDPAETETVVEVGRGVCRELESGAAPEDLDPWLEPVTESIAARSAELSAEDVAAELIGASVEVLC